MSNVSSPTSISINYLVSSLSARRGMIENKPTRIQRLGSLIDQTFNEVWQAKANFGAEPQFLCTK